MKMSVKKFAYLTGVSVRTLHYYDEIGLLKPDFVDGQSGYRFYTEKALGRMQEILFYRELDFTLKNIKDIISSPNYDKKGALVGQKRLLILKKERLEKIIKLLESAEKGEGIMDFDVFDNSEFERMRNEYKDEVKERWGDTDAYRESEERTSGYSAEKMNDIAEGMNKIISEISTLMKSGYEADSKASLTLVEKLKNFISKNQYTCTNDILYCLGEMYESDERFKRNIDVNGDGTAEFISKAIKLYCGEV